jgi:hypothetical protein
MLEQAVKKLSDEMNASVNNPYVQTIGGFLLQHINANSADAKKILAQDKTIIKSLSAMQNEARKKQVGSCAVLTDAEGYAIVLKYFGVDGDPAPAPVSIPKKDDFDIKLEDLL